MGGGEMATERVLGWCGRRYFYVTVKLGSPAHEYSLILDTGSTLTYVPCSDCGSRCGTHTHSPYDSSRSSTYQVRPPSSCCQFTAASGGPAPGPPPGGCLSFRTARHDKIISLPRSSVPHSGTHSTLCGRQQKLTRGPGVGERRCRQ
jgi:hypothetical protein